MKVPFAERTDQAFRSLSRLILLVPCNIFFLSLESDDKVAIVNTYYYGIKNVILEP